MTSPETAASRTLQEPARATPFYGAYEAATLANFRPASRATAPYCDRNLGSA